MAALTAATSPTTKAVTRPLPIFCQPISVDVRGFQHGVARFDQRHQALGFDHAKGFHVLLAMEQIPHFLEIVVSSQWPVASEIETGH